MPTRQTGQTAKSPEPGPVSLPARVACRARLPLLCAAALVLAACASAPPTRNAGQTRPGGTPMVDPSAGLEEVSIQAMSLVGTPYRYGGNTPDSGFDCSGLVRYVVLRAANVSLPRTTEAMGERGVALDRGQVASGDLVFFNTTGRANSHVGIYVGQNRFVHAPSTGGTVRLEDMGKSYWASRYNGARRVASAAVPPPMPARPQPQLPTPEAPAAPPAGDDDPIAAFANR
ncbi:C40 family peptidase [Cupriavidus sp. 2TAF22]|uniref:C40 family peptidase n=1 Tax=unclassified Cupriavidus TaxID=2640874 RepID=UPI003F8F0A23